MPLNGLINSHLQTIIFDVTDVIHVQPYIHWPKKLDNEFVKQYAPYYMLFHKHALTIILKHKKWLFKSKKKVTEIKLTIIPKPHAHLQAMTKELAKFQTDRYKTVGRVVHTSYLQ